MGTPFQLNEVLLIGEMCDEPRISKATATSQPWATVRLYSVSTYSGRDGIEKTRKDFFSVKLFGKLARYAAEDLGKGSIVLVKGQLRSEVWHPNGGGSPRESVFIVASAIKAASSLSEVKPTEINTHEVSYGGEEFTQVPEGEERVGGTVSDSARSGPTARATATLDPGSPEFEAQFGLPAVPWERSEE